MMEISCFPSVQALLGHFGFIQGSPGEAHQPQSLSLAPNYMRALEGC